MVPAAQRILTSTLKPTLTSHARAGTPARDLHSPDGLYLNESTRSLGPRASRRPSHSLSLAPRVTRSERRRRRPPPGGRGRGRCLRRVDRPLLGLPEAPGDRNVANPIARPKDDGRTKAVVRDPPPERASRRKEGGRGDRHGRPFAYADSVRPFRRRDLAEPPSSLLPRRAKCRLCDHALRDGRKVKAIVLARGGRTLAVGRTRSSGCRSGGE